jgi:hypothetical protein
VCGVGDVDVVSYYSNAETSLNPSGRGDGEAAGFSGRRGSRGMGERAGYDQEREKKPSHGAFPELKTRKQKGASNAIKCNTKSKSCRTVCRRL